MKTMKNLIITLAIILSQTLVFAQCPPGDLTIISAQADIDNFQTNYPNCTEIPGTLVITGGNIINLYGLNQITSIGGELQILYTVTLSNLMGLEALTNIDGALVIVENYTMTSLMGLNNLSSVGGDIFINRNNFLNNLNGLNSVVSVGGGLGIILNAKINSLAGLNNLTSVEGVLDIDENSLLTNINGLESLSSVGGGFMISNNDSLKNFAGLENLTSIGGELSIKSNFVLNSISGLESLTSIGGDLTLQSNYALTSLTGLDLIDAGSISNLKIYSNTSLSSCEVWSICNYLWNPSGNIVISNNAPGCNNQTEVEEACDAVSIDDLTQDEKFVLYPNPATASFTIDLSTTPSESSYIYISNTSGQHLITQALRDSKTEIDIRELPAGIYIVMLQAGKEVITQKLVVK
jgi:hypothetical protein